MEWSRKIILRIASKYLNNKFVVSLLTALLINEQYMHTAIKEYT